MTAMLTGASVDRLYRATRTPGLVEVPALRFLCIDGHGDPNTSPDYAEAVRALYAVSYAAKFAVRKAGGADFKVSVLEGNMNTSLEAYISASSLPLRYPVK